MTGSAWILVPAGSTETTVEIVLTDLNADNSVYAAADLSRTGTWQRLVVSMQPRDASGKNLRMGMLVSRSGRDEADILTQCWQLELGGAATSYIPTAGTLGIRAPDDVVKAEPVGPLIDFSISEVSDAVASSIPVATIAWTAVALPYDAS